MLHLLLGAAAAGVLGWLSYAMSLTVARTGGSARVAAVAAVLIGVALFCWLVTAPAVREVAIPLARGLLSVQLPDAVDPTTWVSRRRGLGWVLCATAVGAVAVLALLIGVPAGLSLLTLPFTDEVTLQFADRRIGHSPGGSAVWWTVPLGLVVLGLTIAIQPLFVRILSTVAVRVLGPGPAELLLVRHREFVTAARRNELARQLHDTIGHSLTAIGVQAQAMVAVGESDPVYLIQAARDIRERARDAVADLDSALGLLREGRSAVEDDGPPDLRALVAEFPGDPAPTLQLSGALAGVDPRIVDTAHRVVREALTNAARHGCGPAVVQVDVGADELSVRVQNPIDRYASAPAGGRNGLSGARESVRAAGGTFAAGPHDEDQWLLVARLPRVMAP